MIITKTISKTAPVAEGSILRIYGVNSTGYAVFIENKESGGGSTVVYTFQDSADGTTWNDIEFTVSGSTVTDFSLLPGAVHLLKVTSSDPYIRLTAYGDAEINVSVSYYKVTNNGTSEVSLFESA